MKRYIRTSANISTEQIFDYARTGLIGIVSAFRGYLDETENNERTEELCGLIKNSGYDYAEVTGSFKEANGRVDTERSIVVINPSSPTEKELTSFRRIMCGFAAKFQQDSLFIIYNLSDSPVNHKTVSYVSDWGSSSNDKAYRYNNKTEDDEVDYSDYSYKTKLRKSDRSEPKYIESGYDVIGELWERDQKFKEPEDLVNEVVTRNEYVTCHVFKHITPKIAFAAYSETIDGGAYSIYADTSISQYMNNPLRLQANMFSGTSSRNFISKTRNSILSSTE